MQCPLGHFRRGIFATGRHGAIGAEVFGSRSKAVPRREIGSLETPRLRRRHLGRDPGVFARALDNASPAWIARHVEHRRKGQGDAILRRLFGGGARGFLPKVRGELAGFRQGNGKNRVVAVNNIEAHKQGDAKAGFFHGEALDRARLVCAPEIEQVPDPPGSNPLLQIAKLAGPGDHARRSDHVELPDFFLDHHGREQRIDASHALALSSAASRWFRSATFFGSEPSFASGVVRCHSQPRDPELPPRRRGWIMRK